MGGQSAFDQFAFYEFSRCNIAFDRFAPGSHQAMSSEHGCYRCARPTASAITAMQDAAVRDKVANAVFTNAAFPQQCGRRANQAVVLDSLYDRNTLGFRRIISSGRNNWKSIVEVNNVRAEPADYFSYPAIAMPVPDGLQCHMEARFSMD